MKKDDGSNFINPTSPLGPPVTPLVVNGDKHKSSLAA